MHLKDSIHIFEDSSKSSYNKQKIMKFENCIMP